MIMQDNEFSLTIKKAIIGSNVTKVLHWNLRDVNIGKTSMSIQVTINGFVGYFSVSGFANGVSDYIAISYSTLKELTTNTYSKEEFVALMSSRAETIQLNEIVKHIDSKMKELFGERAPLCVNVPQMVATA